MLDRLNQEVQKKNFLPIHQLMIDLTSMQIESSPQINRIRKLLDLLKSPTAFFANQTDGFIYPLKTGSGKTSSSLKGSLKIGAFIAQNRNENLLKPCSPFYRDFYHPNEGLVRLQSSKILSKSPTKSHIFFHQVHGTSLGTTQYNISNSHALPLDYLVQCPGLLCLNNCSHNACRIENAKDYAKKFNSNGIICKFNAVSIFQGKLPVYLADDYTRLILDELWNTQFILGSDNITYEILFFNVIRKLVDLYLPFNNKNDNRKAFEKAFDHIYTNKIKSGEINPRIYVKDFFAPLNYQLLVRKTAQEVPKPIRLLNNVASREYYLDLGLALLKSESAQVQNLSIKRFYQFPELYVSSRLKHFSHQLHNLVSTNGQFIKTEHANRNEQNWLLIPPFSEINCTEDLSKRLITTLKDLDSGPINLIIQSTDPDDHLSKRSHLNHWIKDLNAKLDKVNNYRWIVIHKPHRIGIKDLHPEAMQLLLPANIVNLLKLEYPNTDTRNQVKTLLEYNYFNPVDLINCAILRQCGLQLSYADYKHLIPLHFTLMLRDLLRSSSEFSKTTLRSTLQAVFSCLPIKLEYFPQLNEYRLLGLALIAQKHDCFTISLNPVKTISVLAQNTEFFDSGFPKSCKFSLESPEKKIQFNFEFKFADFDPIKSYFKKEKSKHEMIQRQLLKQVTGAKQKPRITNYKAEQEEYTLNKALMAGLRAFVEACLK